MKYLLDVNVLVAWGWTDHSEHTRVARWIQQHRDNPNSVLLTSAIPQLGFVRVSVLRGAGQITVEEASETLSEMLAVLGEGHLFISDSQASQRFPEWCSTAAQTTDAHLMQLAESIGAKLASCDQGIPRAYLIPQ